MESNIIFINISKEDGIIDRKYFVYFQKKKRFFSWKYDSIFNLKKALLY